MPLKQFANLLHTKETLVSMLGWLLFMALVSLYCIVYTQWVQLTPARFMASLVWSLQEYASGWVTTPLLLYGLRGLHLRPAQKALSGQQMLLGYGVLTLGSLFMALILGFFFSHAQAAFSWGYGIQALPKHLQVLALVALLWHVFLRPKPAPPTLAHTPAPAAPAARLCDPIRVMKGSGEAVIQWAAVDYICAAGNYMELHCGQAKYLLRTPMKDLQALLPQPAFVRVHRSYIVNLEAITHIGHQPAGNGYIHLRHQQRVPLSKAYKAQLEQLVPKPAAP